MIVIDENNLEAIEVIRFANNKIPWGLWVDETNDLLFAALPNANAIGVVDLQSLTHVLNIQVGECPYAVSIDTKENWSIYKSGNTIY